MFNYKPEEVFSQNYYWLMNKLVTKGQADLEEASRGKRG